MADLNFFSVLTYEPPILIGVAGESILPGDVVAKDPTNPATGGRWIKVNAYDYIKKPVKGKNPIITEMPYVAVAPALAEGNLYAARRSVWPAKNAAIVKLIGSGIVPQELYCVSNTELPSDGKIKVMSGLPSDIPVPIVIIGIGLADDKLLLSSWLLGLLRYKAV